MPNGQVPAAPGFDIGALGRMLGGMNLPALTNMLGGINMPALANMLGGINMNQLLPMVANMMGGGLSGAVPQAQPGAIPLNNPGIPVGNPGLVQQYPGQAVPASLFPVPPQYVNDPRFIVLNTMKPFLPPDKCRIIDGIMGVLGVILTINSVIPRRPIAPPPIAAVVTPPPAPTPAPPPPPPPPPAANAQPVQN